MIDAEAMPFIADLTRVQAERRPEETAFWFEDTNITFAEMDTRANQVANALIKLGVEPGDRIGYLAKNTADYYEILFGAAKARGVMTGVNTRLAAPEIQFVLSDAKAKVLFVGKDFYDVIDQIKDELPDLVRIITLDGDREDWDYYPSWRNAQINTAPDTTPVANDDVIQLYTSGTTGLPKGVCLSNANYNYYFRQCARLEWASYDAGDAVMNAMPLFHVAGVNIGVLGMAQGAKTVILRDIDPALILRLIPEQKIAHAFWVPAVILMLTQQPNVREIDWSSLRQVFYGASPIAQSLLVEATEIMKARFTQLYGLTETVGAGTFLPPEAHDPAWGKLRSCGVPWPGSIIRCIDENGKSVPTGEVGEIVIKAGYVMKGYWNRPEATEEAIQDGFFYTGDAGYFDEDGFLYIHDRIKDMIVSGGENVYPAEVENAIFAHPDVADVAVIGVPDDKWGEAVKAIVVPKPDKNPSPESIINWARERIAAYKCPKTVDFASELPRNPSGKILRKDLRAPFWEGRDRNVG